MLLPVLFFFTALGAGKVIAGPGSGSSGFQNPILPGFHPDPSCIFVPEEDDTFFCASSSFNAFPGIPIHASRDLKTWRLISNALNRPNQLPELAYSNGSTSGIWAPALRYRDGTFYLVTTNVHDKYAQEDPTRWDNIIFQTDDIYDDDSWTDAVHFNFTGYDTSPFWDDDGTAYIVGSHAYRVEPGIHLNKVDLKTGELKGEWTNLWNGTGGLAPEGPHIYRKDGYYYLLVAEGGTGLGHMETIARSKNLYGPYDANPANPILSNANTTEYFQTVGHADLFQDKKGNWWGVALSTRSGPDYITYPMGRETVMYNVTWEAGKWPVCEQVRGNMKGWQLPKSNKKIPEDGKLVDEGDHDIDFAPGSKLPSHFLHWRPPVGKDTYTVSSKGHPYTLRLKPSKFNLTGLDGNYGDPAGGQTFVGRRQVDTLFTYKVNLEYSPKTIEEEAGVTLFLTQNHHARVGIVLLPMSNSSKTLTPHFRFHAISNVPVPASFSTPLPHSWTNKKLTMQIHTNNQTHFTFSAGLASGSKKEMKDLAVVPGSIVSWGFTGSLVGVYATANGGEGKTEAYVSNWSYKGEGQVRENCAKC
ncbi:glycoside hydrolase family 43 protein [Delitschia confertaspora ATCC 74209]|uniref:Glycoside hydrolase family 43 protein n=1 Tax=Delitschia confertaspora ATCC 74209 TaxID=1513339 RepID=A0A9P4JR06_9PLEO|nr:glycoside hydrolase family 43 protein [Delitschia confertaspora ATCC 74209]